MAIWGKDNIVETTRIHKCPYWRIYRTQTDKDAGNVVACSDTDNPNLGLEDSADKLRSALSRLTPGRYLMTAYKSASATKGGISTDIEVESNGANAQVAGIGNSGSGQSGAYIEGIGMVTIENLGEVVEKKFAMMKAKEAEERRIKSLEEENRTLKAEAREHETGINKGLLSIGSIVWERIRGTAHGKEVIGMFNEIKKATAEKNGSTVTKKDAPDSAYATAEVVEEKVGEAGDVPQEMVDALDELAKDNPELIQQLQMMAKLKKEDPEMFKDAIEQLKTVA
jgi:hypothetical protein